MRALFCFLLLLVIAEPMACTQSSGLDRKRAQEALETWARTSSRGGTVEVTGIQEYPALNYAKADLRFTNLLENDNRNFTGTGRARFSHYDDGRWILTEVTTVDGMYSLVSEPHLEVQ